MPSEGTHSSEVMKPRPSSWKAGQAFYLPVKVPLGQAHLNVQRVRTQIAPILADEKIKSFVDGIESTLRELDAVFSRQGIVRVESLGQSLDPHKHQAMIEIATDKSDPGTIVEEMQAGYMLKDRLLRPALVAVAKAG